MVRNSQYSQSLFTMAVQPPASEVDGEDTIKMLAGIEPRLSIVSVWLSGSEASLHPGLTGYLSL